MTTTAELASGFTFKEWPKMPRLLSDIVITEKIDGTNACVYVGEDGSVGAQSRSQILTVKNDNFGFARWVQDNAKELATLGPGYHFGEWAGQGIGRRYNADRKRFFLFNVSKWGETRPACCDVVPMLWASETADVMRHVEEEIRILEELGSRAFPGYMKPEGVVVWHARSGQLFKHFTRWENKRGQAMV